MAMRESFLRERDWVPEATTWYYTTILTDEKGLAISSAQLTTLTLTLYDLSDEAHAIVNAVADVNIKNTGRGLVDAVGKLDLTLTAADTAILDSSHRLEQRRALLEYTYSSGAKTQRHEVDFLIVNLEKVP